MAFNNNCYDPNVELSSQFILWTILSLLYVVYKINVIKKHE